MSTTATPRARRVKVPSAGSPLENLLALQMRYAGVAEPEREYRFCPPRRWRFDFAFPAQRIAVECEGATWSGGRHTRGSGYAADIEKYNRAAILGWLVLRFTGGMIEDGTALRTIEEAFAGGRHGLGSGLGA